MHTKCTRRGTKKPETAWKGRAISRRSLARRDAKGKPSGKRSERGRKEPATSGEGQAISRKSQARRDAKAYLLGRDLDFPYRNKNKGKTEDTHTDEHTDERDNKLCVDRKTHGQTND